MSRPAGPRGRCFVLMPLAGEFQDIYEFAIKPAMSELGYEVVRIDDFAHPGSIMHHIFRLIADSDVILADVSKANPNVFYELGVAHALGRPVILISRQIEDIPFDLRAQRVIVYRSVIELQATLRRSVEQLLTLKDGTRSPVAEVLPDVDRVPRSDLRNATEEIGRLRGQLAQREEELELLRSSSGSNAALFSLRDEIRTFLTTVSQDILAKSADELMQSRVEAERLKIEVASLQVAAAELRKLRQMTVVNPHWKGRDFSVEPDLCFLLMPFKEAWSDDVWKLIESIVGRLGFRCLRADQEDGRVIMDDIWESICKARVVIADLTTRNANVTYEVGLADVVGKQVILLSQTPNDVPFDFLGLRLVTYENSIAGARRLSEELEKRLSKTKSLPT